MPTKWSANVPVEEQYRRSEVLIRLHNHCLLWQQLPIRPLPTRVLQPLFFISVEDPWSSWGEFHERPLPTWSKFFMTVCAKVGEAFFVLVRGRIGLRYVTHCWHKLLTLLVAGPEAPIRWLPLPCGQVVTEKRHFAIGKCVRSMTSLVSKTWFKISAQSWFSKNIILYV